VIPLARVPWNDPAHVMKILDAGAYGVICPMINTAAEAEALVRSCRYAPRGARSWGPVRALISAGADYGDHANDEILVIPMIETAEAVENIDAILTVPGVDAAYVGPADLSLTLGRTPKPDQTDPLVLDALRIIAAACERHRKIAGIHNETPAYSLEMIAMGYRFITLGSDRRFLASKAAAEIAALRTGRPAAGGTAGR
jgi:4-hydroxy-2-oxoheptanedioate aldolase